MTTDRSEKKWGFKAVSKGRKRALELAQKISQSNCATLIIGPTGVGKEVLAQDIHANSARVTGRFVALNCAALTPALFESELFGHQRGAYTGAVGRKLGLVELADQGTLFLDEVGEMPLEMQTKLLRFLSLGTFWPLGSTEERKADVRVIAATNRDLRAMVPSSFREDLFYRLGVLPIVLPALTPEDTQQICEDLAREIARQRGYSTSRRELGALSRLASKATWPGGVRELRSAVERYFLLRDHARSVKENWQVSYDIGSAELNPRTSSMPRRPLTGDVPDLLRQIDDVVFLEVARQTSGVRELAQRLDRTPQAVYDRLRKLGLRPDDLRGERAISLLNGAREALAPYQPWIQAVLNG
ncbi:MAG: sigma 54-interacting transcriptional regulator [Polyangiaceae bacterium]